MRHDREIQWDHCHALCEGSCHCWSTIAARWTFHGVSATFRQVAFQGRTNNIGWDYRTIHHPYSHCHLRPRMHNRPSPHVNCTRPSPPVRAQALHDVLSQAAHWFIHKPIWWIHSSIMLRVRFQAHVTFSEWNQCVFLRACTPQLEVTPPSRSTERCVNL